MYLQSNVPEKSLHNVGLAPVKMTEELVLKFLNEVFGLTLVKEGEKYTIQGFETQKVERGDLSQPELNELCNHVRKFNRKWYYDKKPVIDLYYLVNEWLDESKCLENHKSIFQLKVHLTKRQMVVQPEILNVVKQTITVVDHFMGLVNNILSKTDYPITLYHRNMPTPNTSPQ